MEEVIKHIIELCNEIYNELGSGFAECVYQKALFYELIDNNYIVESEKNITIMYKGHNIGISRIDLYIKNINNINIILELKAIAGQIGYKELRQLETYKKNIVDECRGIIINFSQSEKNKNKVDVLIL